MKKEAIVTLSTGKNEVKIIDIKFSRKVNPRDSRAVRDERSETVIGYLQAVTVMTAQVHIGRSSWKQKLLLHWVIEKDNEIIDKKSYEKMASVMPGHCEASSWRPLSVILSQPLWGMKIKIIKYFFRKQPWSRT